MSGNGSCIGSLGRFEYTCLQEHRHSYLRERTGGRGSVLDGALLATGRSISDLSILCGCLRPRSRRRARYERSGRVSPNMLSRQR